MFKATHKRRATTLSKTLLTAGLMGGAALSTLGAGSAQAAWETFGNGYTCGFGGPLAQCESGVTTPTTVPNPPGDGIYPSDKLLTLLDWVSIPDISTVQFTYDLGPDPHPWHVDTDVAGPGQSDFDGGTLGYTIMVTDPKYFLTDAQLRGNLGSGTITKDIYSSAALYNGGNGGVGDLLTLTSSGSPIAGTYKPVKQVWVRDRYFAGSQVDNFSNDFSQDVPAPLPLLGVGAAFGSIRKLRKFSSQLKTFSMG
ncbi:MAG: hypothetical protein WCP63_08755 [Cyanobium sp. ELA712]